MSDFKDKSRIFKEANRQPQKKSPTLFKKLRIGCLLVGIAALFSACGVKHENIMEKTDAIEEAFNEHNAKEMQKSINELKKIAAQLEEKSNQYGSSEKENQEANYGQYLVELTGAYEKLFDAAEVLNQVSADDKSGKILLEIRELDKKKIPHHQLGTFLQLIQADDDIEKAEICIGKYIALIQQKQLDENFVDVVICAQRNLQTMKDTLQNIIDALSPEIGYSIREIHEYMDSLPSIKEDEEIQTGQTEENSKNTKGTNKVVDWALHGYLGMNRDE